MWTGKTCAKLPRSKIFAPKINTFDFLIQNSVWTLRILKLLVMLWPELPEPRVATINLSISLEIQWGDKKFTACWWEETYIFCSTMMMIYDLLHIYVITKGKVWYNQGLQQLIFLSPWKYNEVIKSSLHVYERTRLYDNNIIMMW